VINAAGYVRVDAAELDRDGCFRANALGAAVLARQCANARLPLLTFSSDLVFAGEKREPYHERDTPGPLNQYGHSKLAAERRVLEQHPAALVVRTSAFFGPWDRYHFAFDILQRLAQGKECLASDTIVSPTDVPDLVHACFDLLIDGEQGIWHLSNRGALSWVEWARQIGAAAGFAVDRIHSARPTLLGWRAPRPAQSALISERGWLMPPLDDALARYLGSHDREQ
jgi:dTDP-4-dehydrorhamnose reductase